MVYLDLFAGSGLNEISDENGKKYLVLGSPILAILASFKMSQIRSSYNCYFDKMILIDSDKQARDILFDRCQTIIDNLGIQNNLNVGHGYGSATNIQIINGDITNSNFLSDLHQYLYQIQNGGKIHLMLFIDPPNPSSIELSLLKSVLSYPSDIIMLLHSGIFAAQVKKQIYNPSTLQKMLGIDSDEANWLLHSKHSHQRLEDYYARKCQEVIQSTREIGIYSGSQFRDVTVVIPIKTTASNYYLLYATRKTGGNSEKWQKPAEAFAKWMGKFSDSGPTAISILQGSQSRLNEFY